MREVVFKITQEDLGKLGWPQDMKIEMYKAYYNWIKEGKPVLEFEYEIERSLAYCDALPCHTEPH